MVCQVITDYHAYMPTTLTGGVGGCVREVRACMWAHPGVRARCRPSPRWRTPPARSSGSRPPAAGSSPPPPAGAIGK
eukprot:1182302-Prorocentrum_minimum.AAC.2